MPRHGSVGAPNVLFLLRQREICGGGRRSVQAASSSQEGDSRKALGSFAEEDFLRRCSASYCELNPPPRSTIATAFSPDGRFLASTHGDHTVKIICHRTGQCLKVLTGHRRTPWVVRFHPTQPHIVASGSLDYEVRVWDVELGKCLICFNFGRPIASLAFHAAGTFLAVASGHKLYMWEYSKEGVQPMVVLKTRRSLRAVHFQPHGIPLLLTAEVNDGNAPAALPLPISADLEEPALLPGAAQGLAARGQLPPLDPAPPSNLTPFLAQGGQPYSAAQQILGITSRAGGADARAAHMTPHPDQAVLATPQMPVHARSQHGTQSLNAFPSSQEFAAGLTAAGHDTAAQADWPTYSQAEGYALGMNLRYQAYPSAWGWLPGQGQRQPTAQSGPLPGPGAEPMDWQQRQGVSTLDLRSRPPRQRELDRRGRDRSTGGSSRGGLARPPNPQSWQGAPGGQDHGMASSSGLHEAGTPWAEAGASSSLPSMQSMPFSSGSIPVDQAPGVLSPWQLPGVPVHAGAPPGFPFYQHQSASTFPRRWPVQPGSLPNGFASRPPAGPPLAPGAVPPVMFSPGQDPLSWPPMWRPVMPQSSAVPMMQPPPAAQGSPVAGRFGFSWPSPGGWTDFRPFQMFRSGAQRAGQQPGSARRHREGRRARGDVIIPPPPPGEMTRDLVEQFDSRWLGTGEHDPSFAPEGFDRNPRAAEFHSRGMHAPLPPSMVPVGWEYPAHLLQQGTIRAGEPAQATYSAGDAVAAPQPGQAQQDAAAVRASAAAANVISNEQPCRVKLRIWRYSPSEDVPGMSGAPKPKAKDKASSKHLPNGTAGKPGGTAQMVSPEVDPASLSTPPSQALLQGLQPAGVSTPAPTANADAFLQATASSLFNQRSSPGAGSAEGGAERQRFAALLQAAAVSGTQATQPVALQSAAGTPQQPVALQGTAVTPQQQPEQARDSSSGQATGPLSGSAALEAAAGGSSDAQPMSEGDADASPVTPQTAEAAGSEPVAMSEGEGRGAGPSETEPTRPPEQELAQQPETQAVHQDGSSAQAAMPSCAAEAAGPSAASRAPSTEASQQQQQQQSAQGPSAAPDQAQAALAAEAAIPEDSSVRRGAVNQPHRASRHAHPKPLEAAVLTISDAVLCSEMGVHFSPCGRLLAACVACQGPVARGPFPAQARQSVAYEVRIYSISGSSFGEVIWAKRIRAAHCLTSLQFSPTSEHILLAYGRRHVSLLRSLVADVESSVVPYHTIVEVYRVAPHMPLMRVLPSAVDEVNAALFHPFKGGGIAYGTKEGRLRVLRHSACAARGSQNRAMDSQGSTRSVMDELIEADQLAAAQVASSDDE